MKYWIIADPHLGHTKLDQGAPDQGDPNKEVFDRPKNFSDKIIKGLTTIPEGDVLICLGDTCFKKEEYWHGLIASSCPKVLRWLVRGNHDSKSSSWYLEHGWHFVAESLTIKMYGHTILFSHEPQKDTGEFSLNIHGHFHNSDFKIKDPENAAKLTDKHLLVAMEYHGYSPLGLKHLVESIKKK